MVHTRSRSAAAGVALALTASVAMLAAPASSVPALATTPPAAASSASSTTSAKERARVDAVRTPKLDWYSCYGPREECATVDLPLDYDHPRGATVQVALLRLKAAKPAQRIGSLFLNPGGPGGSGVAIADQAPEFLSQSLLDRFDIVGFDPRGTNNSQQVKCFKSVKDQTRALTGADVVFPYTAAEKKSYVAAVQRAGVACSTTGRPLSASMSTAEVARDMDVLRRAVGDKKLTYLGFSYGTFLGETYANMFPDRVRALTIDGVLNPIQWAGTKATAGTPVTLRIKSAEGAWGALTQTMKLCDQAGPDKCPIAGNALGAFDTLVARLQAKPIVLTDPDSNDTTTITYATFVGAVLQVLYSAAMGPEAVTGMTAQLLQASDPTGTAGTAARASGTVARTSAVARIAATLQAHPMTAKGKASLARGITTKLKAMTSVGPSTSRHGLDFYYNNSAETFWSVLCTDSLNPANASSWDSLVERANKVAPHFARAWGWESAVCATRTWTAQDEDAYRGPFTRSTRTPVLVVGDFYDPATNFRGAISTSRTLGNARLLLSNSWGHTAYGTSDCVTGAVDSYLTKLALPAAGTVCQGDYVPFSDPLVSDAQLAGATARTGLPPVSVLPSTRS